MQMIKRIKRKNQNKLLKTIKIQLIIIYPIKNQLSTQMNVYSTKKNNKKKSSVVKNKLNLNEYVN